MFDIAAALGRIVSGDLDIARYGGGGEATRFVCGFFGCERQADRLFLAGLPPMLKINLRGDPAGKWLESSIRHLVGESASGRPGGTVLLSKMAEVLFIETLRRYMDEMPAEQTGWLAGARDPVVGAALFLFHRKPCHPWTLAELAAEVGASRSVIAERFGHFLGELPMTYLSRWRLQLAATLFGSTRRTVLQVASDVGYEFGSRLEPRIRREFGLPPGRYRRQNRGGGGVGRPRECYPRARRPRRAA